MVLRGDLDQYSEVLQDSRPGKLDCTYNELLKGGPGWIVRFRNKQLVADWLESQPDIEVVEGESDETSSQSSFQPKPDLHNIMRQLSIMQQNLANLETSIRAHLTNQEKSVQDIASTQEPPQEPVRRILKRASTQDQPPPGEAEKEKPSNPVRRILKRSPTKLQSSDANVSDKDDPHGRLLPSRNVRPDNSEDSE